MDVANKARLSSLGFNGGIRFDKQLSFIHEMRLILVTGLASVNAHQGGSTNGLLLPRGEEGSTKVSRWAYARGLSRSN